MTNRTIAIGDIHGCARALETLLAAIVPTPDDRIVALGDLIDRGPDSKAVLDQLLALGEFSQVVAIRGNHEEMMLRVIRGESPQEWLKHGGVATLDSYGFTGDLSVISESHVQFLERAWDYFETDTHFFTHANYDARKPLDDQDPFVLRWRSLIQSTPGRHVSGKKAVLGHTPDKTGEIFDIGHLVCLDTYCYGGGWLTALDVDNGAVWQANEGGALRG